MESGLVSRLARRLGIAEPDVLRKAEEYLRLSQVKCAGLSARTTETGRAAVCLDLAAACARCPLDRAYLTTLSGLNKKTYQSCLKSFECLLGLNSSVGIRDLAVQFGCTEAVSLASQVLQRILKLKVDKNKMVAASGVKKAIFDRLCKQLEKIGQQVDRDPQGSGSPPWKRKKTAAEPPGARETETAAEPPRKPQPTEDQPLDYEEWKRKILENAARAQAAAAE
ncbi:origin recognition complex subunit 6 isoform X2 [Phyllostomus hastatus]|uniref:origin recognition complex subunit 6 isoform X2 n=1 Tax=Phyllostomus hastatus TaxID=9423 RepID=UPI001E67F259|nr:origin recognition complex subunit 6 isoform X2 [Phyllostomus hastatus]